MFRERERVGIGDGPGVEISPNCPRCGSCNTKFCYYNNYSLTQPRYFCKGCRRYWTKGGSLRNVPVGGGCRKSRRCRSLRVSSCTGRAALMGFARNGNILGESSSSSSSSMVVPDASSNIDLARVYADFLNQSEPETRLEMPGDVVDQSLQFACVASMNTNTNTNTNFNSHFALDSVHEQQETVHRFMSDHTVGDYGLPPLPGEEVVVPPDMAGWPGSEMMVPNHFMHISQLPEIQAEARHLDQLIGNKSSFDMSSFGTFFRP